MGGIRRVAVRILGAPFTRQARRDVGFCVIGALTGGAGFVVVVGTLVAALVMCGSIVGAVIGLPLAVAAIGLARLLGIVHRGMLRMATGERLAAPAPLPRRPGSGVAGWLAQRLRDRDGWRAIGYAGGVKLPLAIAEGYAVTTTVIGLADCVYPLANLLRGERRFKGVAPIPDGHWVLAAWPGVPVLVLLGAVWVLAGVWLARGITIVDARVMRSLLGPSRVGELERTRAIAVEDAAAALRRVERDLHDGAQVRLAAVAMHLGMAQEKTEDDTLRELLDAAQTGVSGALADLRRIARGIHPPVLDSGLADALASLAATSPIPAHVRADLPERPSQAIETMAYFCAAELLANAIKHSSANMINVVVDTGRTGVLRLLVTDDGLGGADLSRGSGLAGLAQRTSTVDGTLRVSSPPGGPTLVTVELPMRIRGRGI
jgi:signal transduction histidine kinase